MLFLLLAFLDFSTLDYQRFIFYNVENVTETENRFSTFCDILDIFSTLIFWNSIF